MKTLLRSCFVITPTDNKLFLMRNFLALQDSGLEFDVQEDTVIWNFLLEFVRAHNHVPDVFTIQSHFSMRGEATVVERAKVLSILPVRYEGDFLNYLENKAQERRVRQTIELFKEAGSIIQSGMEVRHGKEKVKLQGPIDAIRHVLDKSHGIVSPTIGSRLSGEVTRDGVDFAAEYDKVKMDPLAGVGQHTGLHQMDVALNGAKRNELWIHAAFTGGMKSTLMLNWAYNQAIHYQHSSLIFSLEMPYTQCRRILYAIHSSHDKFKAIRFKLGLQEHPDAVRGLDYGDIRDGVLKPNAEKFLNEYVIPDMNGVTHPDLVGAINPNTWEPWPDPKDYGKIYIEVQDPEKSDFTMADLRQKAELIYAQTPYRTLFVDHFGLMSPRKWTDSTTERLNEVIRDAKRLAMSFNRGQGIAVVGLFQINREGYKTALKRKEKTGIASYDLTALSYANECERSADIVTASWIDLELVKANRVQFECLKSRDQKPFERFLARVEWPCRRLLTSLEATMSQSQKDAVGDEIDKATKKLDE